MKMQILGWEYQNIRKGMKDIKVEFTNSHGAIFSNTLFMMANGTGKTTTIQLLKAIFSNPSNDEIRREWTPQKIKELAPLSFDASEGLFRVAVKFDEQEYWYWLQFKYNLGEVKFYTTERNNISGGKKEGLFFPSAVRKLFSKEFASRFVFDGEQAKKVLENESNEAEQSLLYLYRLNEIDDISFNARDLLKKCQDSQRHRETGTGRSTQVWMKKFDELKRKYETICSLEKQQKEKKTEFENKKRNALNQIEKLQNNDSDLHEQFAQKKADKTQIKEKIDSCITRIIDLFKAPANINKFFADKLKTLGENMKELQLPRAVAKDFFIDISKGDTCICGRHIGEVEKQNILSNSEKYLGGEELIILNKIRGRLLECSSDDELKNKITELNTLCDKEHEIEQEIESLQDKSSNKEKIDKLKTEVEQATNELVRINIVLSKISSRDDEHSKTKAQHDMEEAEKNLNEAFGTLMFSARVKKLTIYLDKIKEKALKMLKAIVIQKTNEKVAKVIPDEKIEIVDIKNYLVLKNKKGASEGQTLGIAYCYIGALFEDSELRLPFIVDSPAGKMDLDKRKEVANILPNIFDQLIMFVTSAEVQSFADQFYKLNAVQYITLETDERQICKEPNYDKSYFDRYQKEHKDEEE